MDSHRHPFYIENATAAAYGIPEVNPEDPYIVGDVVTCVVCGKPLPGYAPVRSVEEIEADPSAKALVDRYLGKMGKGGVRWTAGARTERSLDLADAWKRGHPGKVHTGRMRVMHEVCAELGRSFSRLVRSIENMRSQWAKKPRGISDHTIDKLGGALMSERNTVRQNLAPGWKSRHKEKGRKGKPAPRSRNPGGYFSDLGDEWDGS